MSILSNVTNFQNGIQNKNLPFKANNGTEVKASTVRRGDESMNSDSAVSIFNGDISIASGKFQTPDKYIAESDINTLKDFFSTDKGIGYDKNVTSESAVDNVINCYNDNGDLLYKYTTSENGDKTEAYRISFDTNGDGKIDNSDSTDKPTFAKMAQNSKGETVMIQTKYDDNAGSYISQIFEAK